MKILALRGDEDQACGLYRVQLPLEHAAREGLVEYEIAVDLPVDAEVTPDGEVIVHRVETGADIIIFQRPLLGAFYPAMKQAQSQGIACVVELDDDLAAVDPDNVAYPQIQPKRNPAQNWQHLLRIARDADWVTASTPSIAERYAPHGRFSVVRNSLPSSIFDIEKLFDDPPRVGWSGSVGTHPHDLTVLGAHLRTVLRETHASFWMLGEEFGVREQLLLDDSDSFTCVDWVDLDKYHKTLAQTVDVGIVPLAHSKFNEAKSYLKGLEMAGLGIPFVASPTSEYVYLESLGAGSTARKGLQWQKKLKQLITNRDFLLEESARTRDAVRGLTYENSVEAWMQAWTAAISERHATNTV